MTVVGPFDNSFNRLIRKSSSANSPIVFSTLYTIIATIDVAHSVTHHHHWCSVGLFEKVVLVGCFVRSSIMAASGLSLLNDAKYFEESSTK
jgi:hypothetical protein